MNQVPRMKFSDKYRAFILTILILFSIGSYAQTYNPAIHIVVNDAISPAQATPTDSRSMFYDGINFIYRPYQSTSEVLSYLNLAKYRFGNFFIIVDSGGTLLGNGVYLNGHNTYYVFSDTTSSAGLIKLNLFGGGGCGGCLLAANNLSDLANVGTARSNLGLGSMATQTTTAIGSDITGTWPGSLTVAKFNGQLPSYYLNYGNLTNTPPLISLTTIGTSGAAHFNSGTGVLNIPNYSVGGGSCLNCNADTIGNIPLNFTTFCNNCVLTLDSAAGYAYWAPSSGGVATIPPNIGTGFRIYSPQVPGFKTLICGSGCTLDSTTNTNALTLSITSGGTGTVTAFTAGTLNPIFTTSVANGTTTPALSFILSTAPAYNVLMNNTASPAAPVYAAPNATILNNWFGGAIQPAISLTTSGSGAPTFVSNVLNIPTPVLTYTQLALNNTLNTNPGNTVTFLTATDLLSGLLDTARAKTIDSLHNRSFIFPDQTLTYAQNALNNTLAISGGNSQTFLLATHALAGLMDSASKAVVDSLKARTYTWPTFPLYFVQGLSPIGTHQDSAALGGIAGAFFQPDTLYTEYQGLYIYHLNSKATLSAGDSVMILDANKQAKLVPSSAIGGGGAVSSVSDNGGGTLTISPTTGAVLAGLNLGNANTWTASQTMGADLLASTNATINIGSGTNNFANVGAREIKSNGGLILAQAGTNPIQMQANGVNVFEMFGATKDFVINRSGTLVDDSKSLLHVVGKTTIDSALVLNNVTAPPGTYNVLVHGLGDSTTYQVPASAFGGVGQLFTNNQGIGIAGTDTVRQNNLAFVDPTNNGILGINWSGGYDSASWNNFAYLQTNSGTSIVATKIRITEADNTHTNYVRLPTNTCLDQQNLIVGYKIITTNAGDSGMPIRFQSNNPHSVSTVGAYLNPTTKRVMLYSNQNGTVTLYASAPLTTAPVATDSIGLSLVNNYQIWTATATDYATNQTVSITFVNTFIFGQPYVVANTGQVTIFAPNGNYEVDNWIYSSNMPRNQNMGVLGYSITQGFYGGSIAADWARIVTGSVSNGSTVSAGSADYTSSILLPGRLQELHALGYRNWLIGGLIGNDAAAAIAIGTSGPNLVAIYDSIISWGSNVYFSLETPRNATNMTQVDSFMTANWPTLCINVNTPFLGSGTSLNATYDAGDGTHLNAAGHALYAQLVEQSFQYNLILHGGIIPTFTPVTPGGPTTSIQINSGTGFIGYAGLEYINSLNELFSANIAGSQTGGQNLILHSNSALGNGLIGLGSASAFNESNSRLGIGTNAPTAPLDIRGSVAGLNASFGTTDKFTIYPDYAGNGDIPANSVLIGAGVGGLFFSANTSAGTAGNKLGFDYYNGTAQTSGIELANVASGTSIVYLMKGGGKVIEFQNADSATANFQVNGAAWIADSVELKNVRTGTTADSVLVWQFLSPGKGVVHRVAQSSLGGGVTTVGTFSGSSIAKGASISGSTITFGPADGTNPGMIVASGSQTLGATLTLSNALTVNAAITTSSTHGVNVSAKNDILSSSGAGTITSYAVPGSGSVNNFQISAYVNIIAVITDVIQVQVTFTGEDNASHTTTLFPQGVTSANIATSGYYPLPPIFISVKQGTTITVTAIFTVGTGSVTYDAGAIITQMY